MEPKVSFCKLLCCCFLFGHFDKHKVVFACLQMPLKVRIWLNKHLPCVDVTASHEPQQVKMMCRDKGWMEH